MLTSAGHKYEGVLLDDPSNPTWIPDGKGTMWYTYGDVYAGEWKNGERSGTGAADAPLSGLPKKDLEVTKIAQKSSFWGQNSVVDPKSKEFKKNIKYFSCSEAIFEAIFTVPP